MKVLLNFDKYIRLVDSVDWNWIDSEFNIRWKGVNLVFDVNQTEIEINSHWIVVELIEINNNFWIEILK